MNRKVTVVGGAGNVGATVARAIAEKELADVVIIDIADSKAAGVGARYLRDVSDHRLRLARHWRQRLERRGRLRHRRHHVGQAAQAGHEPRRPRARQLRHHEEHRAEARASTRPNAIVIPVANPLDAMAQALFKLTKFPRERIIGMAGVLDSARMSTFIAMELDVSVENVSSFVLGGHGDTMVPLPRYSTVAGIPITELLSKERIDAIAKRTAGRRRRDHQARRHERVVRARSGRRRDGARRSCKDKKKILPCSVLPAGRIRHPRSVRRRAGEARRARRRADHPDQADARRRRGAEEVGRVRERARRRYRDVGRVRRVGRGPATRQLALHHSRA